MRENTSILDGRLTIVGLLFMEVHIRLLIFLIVHTDIHIQG